jgi:hypothetical protein
MDEKTKKLVIIVIEIVGFAAACVGICTFVTGWQNIFQITNGIQFSSAPDCSLTMEISPWSASEFITLNPDRDGWIQADFYSSPGAIIDGYDEISVILEPSLRINVSGASGIAWKYDRSWKKQDVEWCTQKHIKDSWDIRQKKLILISTKELCSILDCY